MSGDSKKLLTVLRDIPLLSTLSDSELVALSKKLESRTYTKGQALMEQGDVGTEFIIIASGRCLVSVVGDSGDSVEIAQLTTGDYCGEQALLSEARRGATVRAMVDTKCLVVDGSGFSQICDTIRFAKRSAKRHAVVATLGAPSELKEEQKQSNDNEDDASGAPDEKTVTWLCSCVADNILFSHLDNGQRSAVCAQMRRRTVKVDECLIVEGEEGHSFFVVESGSLEITVQGVGQVDVLSAGRCVGELALLYNAPRAATVTARSECQVWSVERGSFRRALMERVQSSSVVPLLRKCELLSPLLSSELELLGQALECQRWEAGACIFELGDEAEYFYIVKSGEVKGTAKDDSDFSLTVGGFFGERALLTNEGRAATVTAVGNVECLTLSRSDFTILLGPLEDIMTRNMKEYEKAPEVRRPIGHMQSVPTLSQLEIVGILGRGAFGTVSLVQSNGKSYALKAIRKNQVVEMGQQSHILNEKKVMSLLDNPFLVNMLATYKDEYRVYFLLDVCLGGELFTILRKMRSFDEPTARFYASCVIEAFDYMHRIDCIYRDLKPENLVLTNQGYLKVTDFGFAKIVPNKTFTLCGTPDYLAPEIVTGQGHGKGVDWWTLGILIYEMLASFPPFFDDEPMMTYRKIIQGKFKFPRYLSAQAKDLVSKLLKPKPTKRIGVIKGDIRKHPWFEHFSWQQLADRTMPAPIKNKVKSHTDLSNFDHFTQKDEDIAYKGDPDLGWDHDF